MIPIFFFSLSKLIGLTLRLSNHIIIEVCYNGFPSFVSALSHCPRVLKADISLWSLNSNLSLSLSSFQYAQILRDRLRESIHDVQYVEPPFDDSIAELGKEWKSALAKLKFANSYRMEPLKKFQAHSVETKVQQILTVG